MEIPIGRVWLVAGMFALTAAAGVVDAVAYLRFGQVFVANMTGNILFIGISLDPHSGLSAVAQVVALGGFVVGAALAGRLGRAFGQRVRRWMAVACGGQAIVLVLVAVLMQVGVLGMSLGTTVILGVCFGW